MLKDLSELEHTVSKLEKTAPKLAEVTFFEKALSIREAVMAHWDNSHPNERDTAQSLALRDRIIFLEQRIFDLTAHVPAYTPRSIRLKMKLLMIELGLTEDVSGDEHASEILIKSIFRDLTLFAEQKESNPAGMNAARQA